ncbi:MAG: uridine kinase [Acidobacteriota bacterium]
MRLILIAGPSGAGKSHLAGALAAALSSSSSIGLDEYYHPLDQLTVEERARQNFDHPDALDWPLLESHVATLRRGEDIRCPIYLFDTHTRSGKTRTVSASDVLLIEGIHAMHRPQLRDHADLRIFVSAEEAACLERRIDRDQRERGRTRESVLEQVRLTVEPMAREFLDPVRQYADLIISGQSPVEESVAEIVKQLQIG